MRHRTHFRIRMRKLLSGFLAVSTAITMLGGSAATLLAEEPSTEYALAGAGTGEDITIHFGDEEDKSISVHVNPESNSETLAGLGTEAAGDETESETENTGLKEVKAGGFVTISSVDETLLPEEAEASAEILSGKAENTAVEKVEEVAAAEPISETSDPTGSIAQDSKEEEEAGAKNAPEEEAAPEATGKTEYQAFDISLDNVDEDQYQDGFKVEVSLPEDVRGRDFRLFHIHEGEEPVEIPVETVSTIDPETGLEVVSGFEFTTDGFSEFVLQYTVDFHYEINGKMYEFSIPGGGFVSLEHVVEVLGIATADANAENGVENGNDFVGELPSVDVRGENGTTYEAAIKLNEVEVSEATKKFVANVESVEFSSPELVWVGKAEDATTIGGIKESRGLEVEYSAELTEEQIAGINNSTVEAGDWALISVQPFTSEETLTVTMKDGEVFTIQVTDAQIRTTVISEKGDTWEIIVTYDDTAGIPEDAQLQVSEISEEEEAYAAARQEIKEGLEEGAEKIPSHPVLFDISIWADGQEIEPVEGSQVLVEIRLVKSAVNGMYTNADSPILINDEPVADEISEMGRKLQVLHLTNDDQIDVMETQDTITDEAMVSSFTTESFSNWLVFLDEDLDTINVKTGDSLTLRPYSEWVWKQSDELSEYRGGAWIFPEEEWNSWTARENNVQYTFYQHKRNGSRFRSFEKNDSQLHETYTVVTSENLKVGSFTIQTNKGKTITVNVTQGAASGKPATVGGITGLTVNLFDYDVPRAGNDYDFTRSGSLDEQSNVASNPKNNNNINTNHDLKFLGYGGSNVASNNNWFWINNYTNENPSQGIVKDALGDDGYPQLGPGKNGLERGNPSLKYLFDPTSKNHNVYAFPNADGLFQQDNQGYYYYNSNSNYAEYDRNTNRFVLYEHTYSQNTGGSNGANAKPIGFFPFHEYDTVDTQPEMNFNKNLNHHFGMSMDVTFEIPPGNKQATGPDGNKHDIIYEFSGDDDLWVFVDDQLVLDIGGIHQPVTGTINFTTGEIKVHGVADKTMTFDVGGHTLKMFYIERGGCDSNLSVRFNLPLIVGKGDVRVVKKSMGTDETNEDTALPFAVFGIWDNPECSGDPYTVATSDLEGIINKNLPIRQVPQMYYMREMIPPAGYTLDRTIFTLTADGDKDADGDYVFTVSSNGTQLSETDNVLGCPIIWNQAVVPIKLKVKKQWQNADGTELTPDPTQATFAVKRTRTYSSVPMYTVMLRTDANNNQVFDTIIAHEGDVLTIAYTHTQDSNNYAQSCYAENGQFAVSLPTSKTIQQSTATYTVNHNHANQGTSNIVIVIPWESFAKYCNPEMNASCAFPHFENIQTAAYDMMTEVDTAFNSSDHKITVYSNGGWQAESEPFPAQETVSGVTYYYEYSIVEESVPDGYEVIYLDASGNPSTGSSSPSTSVGGEIGVINREFLDVPVEKQWGAFSSDRYTWEATFKLQKMEEKKNETDPDATDALVDWTDVKNTDEENVTLTIIKGQTPTPKFENLPVYVTHSNGTVYRQLYRADETAYKVCRVSDNKVVAQWSEDSTVQVIGDKRYVPKFAQYAGEPGPINSDYEIKLLNVMEEQTQDKEIGLSIEKTWPEATGLADDSNASATFELKRKVHTETRNYSNTNVQTQWVDITLDTKKDGTKLQTLTVPVGTTMHILGSVKPGKDATITFSQSQEGGQPIVETVQNTTGSDQMPFDITFTADQVKAVTLEAGEDFVVGGVDGFRLSDYTERTDDVVDSTYSNTFTLNANSWSKVIQDLPQVVEGPINSGVQTITVYSYYLVETDCNPKDFDPQYEIGGVVVADVANNAVTTTSTLTVNNVQKTTDVTLLKVDASKVNLKSITDEDLLKGAAFTILKYPSKDAQGMDTSWGDNGTMTLRDEEQQDGTYTLNGRFNFEGLTTGYYVIDEIAFPDGYVRVTEKPTFTVDVDASGELVVHLENDAGGLVRMIDGELTFVIGNTPGFALPATGGPGTRLFTILGSIMILGAGVLLWRRRRLV